MKHPKIIHQLTLVIAFTTTLLAADLAIAKEKGDQTKRNIPAKSLSNLSDGDVARLQYLPIILVPTTNSQKNEKENAELAQALIDFSKRESAEDARPLLKFINTHNQSRWNASLWANLGNFYYNGGYFSKALDAWENAWNIAQDEDGAAKRIADYAVTRYLRLASQFGRKELVEPLLKNIENRPMSGSAGVLRSHIEFAVWGMNKDPDRKFRCGPRSLLASLESQGEMDEKTSRMLMFATATPRGISASRLKELARNAGAEYQVVKRDAGAEIVIPCVAHWKQNHYSTILKHENGKYLIHDKSLELEYWISEDALNSESSGYFIIPGKTVPLGYHIVESAVADKIQGRGLTEEQDPDGYKPNDPSVPPNKCPKGMASYSVKLMLVSLTLEDTPVWYTPSTGPNIPFTLTYNQRDIYQPPIFNHSNCGDKWTFNWLSYVIDNPQNADASVKVYLRGGGAESYGSPDASGNYSYQKESRVKLVRSGSGSSVSYTRYMPDGSTETYAHVGTSTDYPRYVYLTKVTDPQGREVNFNYDSDHRITSVIDAVGNTSNVFYEYTSTDLSVPLNYLKITKIVDPFGRRAQFSYDDSGNLVSITDMMNLSSQFTYSGDDITSLTTPYGTTTFTTQSTGAFSSGDFSRSIEITDPLNQKEKTEYRAITNMSQSESAVPSGMGTLNDWLHARNTFYWDKKTTAAYGTSDYSKAMIYHFLHTSSGNMTSNILESIKKPLESRIWYNYPNQVYGTNFEGSSALRTAVGRVLDDGSSQVSKYEYNNFGAITKVTDPLGRETRYTYDANGIDCLKVEQKNSSGGYDVVAETTYNAAHQTLTVKDSAGQTTTYTYSNGDLATITTPPTTAAPSGQKTTFAYYSNHLVHTVQQTTSIGTATIATYTYDGYNRVKTITDSEGYTLTYDYDNFDRVTKVTYPDGTFGTMTYNRLDLASETDRLGNTTHYYYNPLRQLVMVKDPLQRITQFAWCACGAMSSLTDPMNRTTSWAYDIQGRLTAKTYPDASQTSYAYENATSRLKSRVDARGVTTAYIYNKDDTLQKITYTRPLTGLLSIPSTSDVTFTYNLNYKRIVTMVDGTGTTTYTYGAVNALGANQVASIDGPLANDTIQFGYDALRRVTSSAINGASQSVVYDALNRAAQVTNSLGTFNYAYLRNTGRLAGVSYPNGQSSLYTYYGGSGSTVEPRLQQIQNLDASGSALLSQFNYEYDANGQISRWTQAQNGNSSGDYNYTYDAAGRLVRSLLGSSVSGLITNNEYVYDDNDNRITEQRDQNVMHADYNNLNQLTTRSGGGVIPVRGKVSKPSNVAVNGKAANVDTNNVPWKFWAQVPVNVGTNQFTIVAKDGSGNASTNTYQLVISGGSGGTYSYDANGNLTSDGARTYTWDAENRLASVTANGNTSEFTYDGIGRRVKEKVNGTLIKQWIWIGTVLAEERDGNNFVTRRFYNQGEEISGTSYYYTLDHLGSIREMSDANGNVVAQYQYDSWGRKTKITGSVDSDFGYARYYYHTNSGLNLTLYRAYDPDTARWISRDPIGENAKVNLYGYCYSDPINLMDPLGLFVPPLPPSAGAIATEVLAQGWSKGPVIGVAATGAVAGAGIWAVAGAPAYNWERGGFDLLNPWWRSPDKGDNATSGSSSKCPPTSSSGSNGGSRKPPAAPPSFPSDPSQPPGSGWEWRGNGAPGSSQGSWYNPSTGESLHPDLNHPDPIGPHYDYIDPSGNQFRILPGGGSPVPK